jgi:hypothetical protein
VTKKTQTILLPEDQQRIIGNYMKWLLLGTVLIRGREWETNHGIDDPVESTRIFAR